MGSVTQSWADVTREVLRSLVLLVCLRFSLGASQCLVGILVLSVLLSCEGMVPQCVSVESPSWFHSLNHQDHDMTPSQCLTLPRVRFKVNGVVSTLVLGVDSGLVLVNIQQVAAMNIFLVWGGLGHMCICEPSSQVIFWNTHVLWFAECLSLVSGGRAQSLCLRLLLVLFRGHLIPSGFHGWWWGRY